MTLIINKSANATNGQFLFEAKVDVSHFRKSEAYQGCNCEISSAAEINIL